MSLFLEFQNVSYSYPHRKTETIRELSFSIQRKEFVGILGANDSGKSTIAKLTNGLLLPSQGHVVVDGIPVAHDEHVYTIRQKIGIVFADPENQIVGSTVEEEVAFGLGNLRVPSGEMRKRVDTYLEGVGLLHYATRAPHHLSGGEQQKLCLTSVLAMEPDALVLDAPLTFLDRSSQREILALLLDLHARGMTLLYLTSDPEELVQADRILLLHQGSILIECSPTALWNDFSFLEQAGIMPSDIMLFRKRLKQQGYAIQDDSFTPEEITQDCLSTHIRHP